MSPSSTSPAATLFGIRLLSRRALLLAAAVLAITAAFLSLGLSSRLSGGLHSVIGATGAPAWLSAGDLAWQTLAMGLLVGFVAQLIDGALGMAYGLAATSLLMSQGISPVAATASVHISEIFTTAASGLSHWRLGNVDRGMLWRLVLPGVIGALVGVGLLTWLDAGALRPWVALYVLLMGLVIVARVLGRAVRPTSTPSRRTLAPLAFTGACLDSVGGGGWGPVVTSTLLGRGHPTRSTIGTVNTAEFFVTLASGFSFVLFIGVQQWELIAGLVLGGVTAAPIAAQMVRKLPERPLLLLVGGLIVALGVYNVAKAWA